MNFLVSYLHIQTIDAFSGLGRYMFDKGILDTAYGGVYDDEKNLVALEWDSAVRHIIE